MAPLQSINVVHRRCPLVKHFCSINGLFLQLENALQNSSGDSTMTQRSRVGSGGRFGSVYGGPPPNQGLLPILPSFAVISDRLGFFCFCLSPVFVEIRRLLSHIMGNQLKPMPICGVVNQH